jgi:AdoMet-dependent rRNA methyltransferase SPB1
VCIDLCAAPGGWCQVAAKYMPASSIILGIDLLPIRPIRGVKTFQCDITTVRCRQIIKQEMQSWQADVVLCDGAPNVGAEYSKDAYVQNELSLVALKLAVDVMGRGGTFVSKVFRSQDYNALLWVFKQLFKKVSATKPLSSRNESAEIFVVCENFLAPQSIDPKLFDPKYVFDQVNSQEKSITIFHPKFGDRKRHREGMSCSRIGCVYSCMSAAFSRVSSGLSPLAASATCSQEQHQAFPVPAHAANLPSGGGSCSLLAVWGDDL